MSPRTESDAPRKASATGFLRQTGGMYLYGLLRRQQELMISHRPKKRLPPAPANASRHPFQIIVLGSLFVALLILTPTHIGANGSRVADRAPRTDGYSTPFRPDTSRAVTPAFRSDIDHSAPTTPFFGKAAAY